MKYDIQNNRYSAQYYGARGGRKKKIEDRCWKLNTFWQKILRKLKRGL